MATTASEVDIRVQTTALQACINPSSWGCKNAGTAASSRPARKTASRHYPSITTQKTTSLVLYPCIYVFMYPKRKLGSCELGSAIYWLINCITSTPLKPQVKEKEAFAMEVNRVGKTVLECKPCILLGGNGLRSPGSSAASSNEVEAASSGLFPRASENERTASIDFAFAFFLFPPGGSNHRK